MKTQAQTQHTTRYSKELFSWQEMAFAFVVLAMILNIMIGYGVSARLTGS